MIYISIIEAFYLLYMFHFYKTSIDFSIGDSPSSMFFQHAKGNDKTLRICPFGQYAIIPLILLLLLRNFIQIPSRIIKCSIAIALLLSLINLNALVYIFPVALVELFFS